MTDTNINNTQTILSLCATTADKVKDINIKNGQILFIHDLGRVAMDLHGKRTFYNQIIELETEQDRINIIDAVNGKYYFVIETAVLWRYSNEWIQITTKPEDVVFIGTELPSLGQSKTLYVDKDDREISIWDEETNQYKVVSNYTDEVSNEDIESLFK